MASPSISQEKYPRITLHCGNCGNEFNINVMRLKPPHVVSCQICGAEFPQDLGEEFVKSLEALFQVKYGLEKQKSQFELSFLYQSTFHQPPAPYPFSISNIEEAT